MCPCISSGGYNKHDPVMFRNTHSIFADIIWAEIFEPNLSNLIPDLSHVFMRFHTLPVILTFLEPLVCIPRAIPRPCFQILHSITPALIVSDCLLFSCCIMIRDIASHAPSIVPSEYCLHSLCIPDFVSSGIYSAFKNLGHQPFFYHAICPVER